MIMLYDMGADAVTHTLISFRSYRSHLCDVRGDRAALAGLEQGISLSISSRAVHP